MMCVLRFRPYKVWGTGAYDTNTMPLWPYDV